MDEKPYKFDPKNPRLVTNVSRPEDNIKYLTGTLFLGSVYLYATKRFRVDKNAIKLLMFTGGSALASYAYADFFLSSPIIEAGLLNNEREKQLR